MDLAWITFIFTVFILTRDQEGVVGDCSSDLADYFRNNTVVYLKENTLAGEIIANITEFDELEATTEPSYYLDIVAGTLRSNKTLSLDGSQNKDECARTKNAPPTSPRFAIKCKNSNAIHDVFIIFTYTDDFTPIMAGNITVLVSEDTAVSTSILDPESMSTDEDCNNGFLFFVFPVSDYFIIDAKKMLVLNKALDYERQTEHNVSIVVRSSVDSIIYKNSSSTVRVRVTDVDDMNPVFDISHFVLHVQEEQPASSVWVSATPPVKARDGDVGINTPLVYSVEYPVSNISLDIHNETGEIKILDKLDREQIPSYTVQIKAAQVDLLYKSATATLTIIVDDINDNRPIYTSMTSATIMEDAKIGSNVIQLAGTDKDEGANAEFLFLIESDSLGAFEVVINSITKTAFLAVKDSSALRGHEQAQVKLYLNETLPANGGPACDMITICVANVTINITDVNDNDPIFTSSSYNFTVLSSQSASTDIGRVEATDADRGENANIVYSLIPFSGPSECSKVILDPGSGKLTLTQQLTAETECYWLVTACDTPTDRSLRRCSSVPMSLKVLLTGDTIFLNVTVLENVPVHTLVMSLPIKGLHTSSPEFEIKEDILYTKNHLDREQQERYTVQLFRGNDMNSTAVVISINIQDVNDNAPDFTYKIYVINLDESIKINQTLLQVNATDADIEDNGRFKFSLVTGGEWFEIDPTTGQIKLVNFLRTNNVDFLLQVTDLGHPPLQSLATLKVYIPVYNETATLLLPVAKEELMQDRDGVARKLSSILSVTVNILAIESIGPVSDIGSRLYIEASRSGQAVSPTELSKLLDDKSSEVYNAFMKATSTSSPADKGTDDLGTLSIILICVAGTLLLLVVVVGILWIRSHHKYKRSVRLLDTLSRDTTINDNPRKLRAASSGNNNNNVNNAEQMLDSISKGSVGSSSVTRLLPRLGLVNPGFELDESLAPAAAATDNEGSPQTVSYENMVLSRASNPHIVSGYENMLLSHASNPLTDNNAVPPIVTNEEPVTRFGPDTSDVITISTSPVHVTTIDIRQRSHAGSPPPIDPENHTRETWPGDTDNSLTEGQVSRKSSGADSGMSNDRENRLEDSDENDQEVANIMSDAESSDNTDSSPIKSILDLMTAFHQSEQSTLEQHNNTQTTSNKGNERDTNLPPEPEPDYAKKVRFIEEPVTTKAENEPVLESSSHDVLVDASDEMTAL